LLSAVSLTAPDAIGRWIGAFALTLIPIWLVAVALVVIGLRRLVLGPARKQNIPPSRWLVSYLLAALPISFAAICLIIVVALAWVFHWQARVPLTQALVLLLLLFFVVSVTVKTALNAQLLMRHWFGR
jgi:hypothetical protein